jgi:hypothetical protein
MSSDEDGVKPIGFRPSKELVETLKIYMGVHKIKSKTEAIEKIIQEWRELTQKTQTETSIPQSQPQQATSDNLPEKLRTLPLSNPIIQAYMKEKAKHTAQLEFLAEREKLKISTTIEREDIQDERERERLKKRNPLRYMTSEEYADHVDRMNRGGYKNYFGSA